MASQVICPQCGTKAARRYFASLRQPIVPFEIKVSVTHAGESKLAQVSSLGPRRQRDGSMAMVFQEIDKHDPDKTNRRYRKHVIREDGVVLKDIDVALQSPKGHGPVGHLHDLPPPTIPGDPMRIVLGSHFPKFADGNDTVSRGR
jgi:hypothetical protein